MSTGERIRNTREDMDILQQELADAVGINVSVLSRIEKGIRQVRDDELVKIANKLHVTTDYLLGRTNSPNEISSSQPALTDRDEHDIQKKLQAMLDDLDPNSGLAYYNGQEPMDDETRDLIRSSLETSLRTAKQIAKSKYTPKKYRKEEDTATRIGKKILDASPSAQIAVSQIIDKDKHDDKES